MQIDSIVCHYRYGCLFDFLPLSGARSLGNRFEAYTANDLLAELISLRLNLEGLTTYGTDNCSLVWISAQRRCLDSARLPSMHEINHSDGYLLVDQPSRARVRYSC